MECLELEDTCQSLKQEIKDAWSTYTSMQEKTSIREGELVEEISQLEKLRSSDAAKWAAQQSLVESDVNVLRSIQLERDEALVQIADLKDSLENVAVVTKGITEAATQDKLMNQQQYHLQIQELHTEIRTLKEANEQIIQERNDSVRQANLKQSEIEQLTTDDAQQMSALYQENRQLQEKLKLVGLDNTTISELEQLRVRYTEVSQQLNTLLESKSKWELKYVELEKYHGNVLTTERAAQMSLVSQLQDRLSAATAAVHRRLFIVLCVLIEITYPFIIPDYCTAWMDTAPLCLYQLVSTRCVCTIEEPIDEPVVVNQLLQLVRCNCCNNWFAVCVALQPFVSCVCSNVCV